MVAGVITDSALDFDSVVFVVVTADSRSAIMGMAADYLFDDL